MADQVCNIAKGRVVEFYANVKGNAPANSAFVVVLLKVAEADDTLRDYADLAALLAGGNTEADFTNYVRVVLTDADIAALPAADNTNNRRRLDLPDITISNGGGATNNNLVKALICYDPDTTAGDDSQIVPCTHHDYVKTTNGQDVIIQINSNGFYEAA